MVDALGVVTDRAGELGDGVGRQFDPEQRGSRGDPAAHLAGAEPEDVLDDPAGLLDHARQIRHGRVRGGLGLGRTAGSRRDLRLAHEHEAGLDREPRDHGRW